MSVILHVVKPGHRCANPLRGKTPPASYIKAGGIVQLGHWFIQWSVKQQAYFVISDDLKGLYYQFSNFNCAAAKLAELGR